MNRIKSFLFRKAVHWFVDEDLDQWERFIVIGKKRTAYVRIDVEKPDQKPDPPHWWNQLKP